MPTKLPDGDEVDELLIYQIALGANGVASLAAGNEAIAVASFALLGFVAFVASARK
jgi:hypothetical protein